MQILLALYYLLGALIGSFLGFENNQTLSCHKYNVHTKIDPDIFVFKLMSHGTIQLQAGFTLQANSLDFCLTFQCFVSCFVLENSLQCTTTKNYHALFAAIFCLCFVLCYILYNSSYFSVLLDTTLLLLLLLMVLICFVFKRVQFEVSSSVSVSIYQITLCRVCSNVFYFH